MSEFQSGPRWGLETYATEKNVSITVLRRAYDPDNEEWIYVVNESTEGLNHPVVYPESYLTEHIEFQEKDYDDKEPKPLQLGTDRGGT